MKSKAVFLDRDNTLIYDKGYTNKPDDLKWIPGSINCLQSFSSKGFKLIVITNQSGVARGYYNEKELHRFHIFMNAELFQQTNIFIDKFYYCPHFLDGKITSDSTWWVNECVDRYYGAKIISKSKY